MNRVLCTERYCLNCSFYTRFYLIPSCFERIMCITTKCLQDFPACTIDRDSRSIAILGVILMLLLREQITTFWRVYHLCTYKRCKKMRCRVYYRTFLQHSTRKVVKILHLFQLQIYHDNDGTRWIGFNILLIFQLLRVLCQETEDTSNRDANPDL